ncbi:MULTISPECIES: response regulator transcription factor [Caulobacter]|uniref:Response regulator n=2 Tax=Caulobacter TaxID=75 RepID=A0A2T9J7M3_9CAUL|nr:MULTISPECIES: response regulator [Caulobacter]MBI1684250.1 response regulator [Caulobacter hibisci]PVM77513.1 response regulator [Caulobacter radicis]
MNILIVDDDPLVRDFAASTVQLAGAGCNCVADGAQALELLQVNCYDLVLIDLFMPVKEGIETIIEIRRTYPSVGIIAMSSGAGPLAAGQMLASAMALGADAALCKPFSADELWTTVRRLAG